MNTLVETARSARYDQGEIVIELSSGGELRFRARDNPRLAKGTPKQLSRIEVSPFGLHWPELDEDFSLRGIAMGDHGQRVKKS